MNRRRAAVLCVALASLVAAGSVAAAGARPLEGVLITHLVQAGATDRLAGYRVLAARFTATTGATVRFVPAPWAQMQSQAMNDFIAQTGNYDVLDLDPGWDANVRAHLEDLDAYIQRSRVDMRDYQGLNGRIGVDPRTGRHYGIPFTGRSMVLYYRADVLRAAGIAPPATWSELIAAAKALTRDGFYGFVAAGVDVQLNKYFYAAYKGDSKRSLFDPSGKPLFAGEEGARALDILKALFRHAPRGVYAMDIAEADQVFLNGDAAFLLEWPDYIEGSLDDTRKSRIAGKWSAMKPPGPGNYAGWYLGLSRYSRHKRAGWAWIKFLTDPEQSRRLMLDYGVYSARASVLADPAMKAKYPDLDAIVSAAAASFQPRVMAHPKALDWFVQTGGIWSAALNGRMSSEAAVQRAAALWTRLFNSVKNPPGYDYSDLAP